MQRIFQYFLAIVILGITTLELHGQEKNIVTPKDKKTVVVKPGKKSRRDSTNKRNTIFNKIFNRVKSSVVVTNQPNLDNPNVLNTKSVVPYIQHQGKVIRKIITDELGFETLFTDTSSKINHFGTRLLNALHTDTYGWVIRDNLFLKEGDRVNPYLVSDNERYLRTLEFIQDARIFVRPVANTNDSVDVVVITKDLFSITGSIDLSGIDRQKVRASENNLAGAGQKIQVGVLRDKNRNPNFGYDVLYSKNSIAHTYVTGTIGYSSINSDPNGSDHVETFYIGLERPLYSPYSRIAGSIQLAFNRSKNTLNIADSQFYSYKNTNFDGWVGYNIGVRKLLQDDRLRNRTFIAGRYIHKNFAELPFQVGKGFNNFYNNRNAILGEVTFFRQEFYKTNYIYGFGTTEDVPYGYSLSFTGGYYKQLDLSRPYFGFNANFNKVSEKGRISQYYLRNGLFLNNGQMQDVGLIIGGSTFSRLFHFKHFKMRQYYRYNFSRLFNRTTYDPLQINNALGLRYFNADTLRGTQRMSFYTESFFFAKYKLFGFLLAPFVFVDASMLKGEGKEFYTSDIYTGLGGGVRTRNINLVFGTAELRAIYFPRKAQEASSFKISLTAELQFRYNSNYIRAPEIIQLNSEDGSNFY